MDKTKKPTNQAPKKTTGAKSISDQKPEKYSKQWRHVYYHNKPALQHQRTKEIIIPSEKYIKKHHPRGPWDS